MPRFHHHKRFWNALNVYLLPVSPDLRLSINSYIIGTCIVTSIRKAVLLEPNFSASPPYLHSLQPTCITGSLFPLESLVRVPQIRIFKRDLVHIGTNKQDGALYNPESATGSLGIETSQ